MTGSVGLVRLLVIALGLCLVGASAVVIAVGGGAIFITGLWLLVIGVALVVATLLERMRYRSDATDRSGDAAGPGGGEPLGTRLDPRFRRTDEVFTDPTSGHLMRVWMDPASGERRYVAEG